MEDPTWGDLGKRVPKLVRRDDFIDEEELEVYLRASGVTADELLNDLKGYNDSPGFAKSGADIFYKGKRIAALRADEAEGEAESISDWLEHMSPSDLWEIWHYGGNQSAIGSLIRYPGGLHEWLMVAVIPYLREMGIPMDWIKIFRDETAKCWFYCWDSYGELQECWHGETGSGHMHRRLMDYYMEAYQQWQGDRSADAKTVLAEQLKMFVAEFYPPEMDQVVDSERPEWQRIPCGLCALLNELGG